MLKTLPDGGKVRYIYNGGSLDSVIIYASGGSVTCYLKYLYSASGELEYILRKKDNLSDSTKYDLFAVVYNAKGEITKLIKTRYQTSTGVGFTYFIVANYEYDAYGSVTITSPVSGEDLGWVNPLRYKNYIYDTETDWYYLQTRFYDPTVGRFLNADGYADTGDSVLGTNMFAYCGNNPVCNSDPAGMWCPEVDHRHEHHDANYGFQKTNEFNKYMSIKKQLPKKQGKTVYYGQPRIDTDGSDGSKVPDKSRQDYTSLARWHSNTVAVLDAYEMPYVVMPGSGSAKLGDTAFLINWDTGQLIKCIVGDVGNEENGWGEVSIAALWKTGYPNHMTANNASGITNHYEIILYDGVSYDYDWNWGYRIVKR